MIPALGLVVADRWNGGHMDGGWMWLWAMLGMAILVATVVVAVILVTRTARNPEVTTRDGGDRTRSIARERYARGEISATEYDELTERLR